MNSRLMRSARIFGVAFFLHAMATTAALAQPKPALVQDVDEPGRIPYQKTVSIGSDSSTCVNNLFCEAVFPAVPAGKRLVVTYLSADYSLQAGGTLAKVGLGFPSLFSDGITLPATSIGLNRYVAAGPVTFYFEAGDTPTVRMFGQFVAFGFTDTASLVGYLVSVP